MPMPFVKFSKNCLAGDYTTSIVLGLNKTYGESIYN